MKKEKQIILAHLNLFDEELPIKTVENNQDIIKDINNIYVLWNDIAAIMKNKYKTNLGEYEGYDGAFQFLNAEAYTNIEASIILAVHGYYRQAISLLRCWFENSLYGLFFNDHKVEFTQWLYEDEREFSFMMNFRTDFLNYLFKLRKFDEFNMLLAKKWKKTDMFRSFRDWIEQVYTELSAHIHGRGVWRASILLMELEKHPRKYNKESFEYWDDLFANVFNILITSYLLYNPELLNRFYVKRKKILDRLNKEVVDILTEKFGVKY